MEILIERTKYHTPKFFRTLWLQTFTTYLQNEASVFKEVANPNNTLQR